MSQLAWLWFDAPSSDDDGIVRQPAGAFEERDRPQLSAADAEVVRQIRAGNSVTFEQLFRAEYQGLVTYLSRTIGTVWDAEELVQRVFVQLWERHEQFAPKTNVRTYLYGAARHAALNHFRATRRANPSGAENTSVSSDLLMEMSELERAAMAAVEQLPPRAQEIWTLHREHGLTVAEVARQLGISTNTVKTHLSRSLASIRAAILPFLLALIVTHF